MIAVCLPFQAAAEGADRVPGLLHKLNEHEELELPEDPTMMPDAVVHLCDEHATKLAFIRVPAAKLLASGKDIFTPTWQPLHRTEPHDPEVGKPLPALLLSASLTRADEPGGSAAWEPTREEVPRTAPTQAYEIRVHCFQGRNLPSRDADGSLDPYIVASLCDVCAKGQGGKTRTAVEIGAAPQWYETLRMPPLELPPLDLARQFPLWPPPVLPPRELAPQLVIEVWDDDTRAVGDVTRAAGKKDDLVTFQSRTLTSQHVHLTDPVHRWVSRGF